MLRVTIRFRIRKEIPVKSVKRFKSVIAAAVREAEFICARLRNRRIQSDASRARVERLERRGYLDGVELGTPYIIYHPDGLRTAFIAASTTDESSMDAMVEWGDGSDNDYYYGFASTSGVLAATKSGGAETLAPTVTVTDAASNTSSESWEF